MRACMYLCLQVDMYTYNSSFAGFRAATLGKSSVEALLNILSTLHEALQALQALQSYGFGFN